MLQTFHILIDGLAYQGENLEAEYETNIGGKGWHTGNHNKLNDLIIGTGTPKEIVGMRGLTSELERITKRMQDGRINPKEIKIVVAGEYKPSRDY